MKQKPNITMSIANLISPNMHRNSDIMRRVPISVHDKVEGGGAICLLIILMCVRSNNLFYQEKDHTKPALNFFEAGTKTIGMGVER